MGLMARLEFKNKQLEDKLLAQESRICETDLMFYNLADSVDETNFSLKQTLFTVMRDAMKIPVNDLFHRNNTAGEIRIDTASRIRHDLSLLPSPQSQEDTWYTQKSIQPT